MDRGFDRGLFCFCQKISKNLFLLPLVRQMWIQTRGQKKVSSKNINLETNKGINLDTNKVSDKVPEMRTGSGTNKSQDNKSETDKDANENSNKSGI